MSILIKGMKMPKNSRNCPFAVMAEDWEKECIVGGRYEWNPDRVCEGCPLVEVPPHGRLIDSDELLQAQFHPLPYTHITPSDIEDSELYQRAWNDALSAVYENAVTIIEAEEGE